MDVDIKILNGSSEFCIKKQWNKEQVERIPARTLAYIGDSVYELRLRMHLVSTSIDQSGRLHSSLVDLVNSVAQAKLFDQVFENATEFEQGMLKTWRNAKSPARYGSGTRGEYARATAIEAWVGYLFLTGQNTKLDSLFESITKQLKEDAP